MGKSHIARALLLNVGSRSSDSFSGLACLQLLPNTKSFHTSPIYTTSPQPTSKPATPQTFPTGPPPAVFNLPTTTSRARLLPAPLMTPMAHGNGVPAW